MIKFSRSAFIIALILLINVSLPANADVILKSLKKPLSFVSETNLSIESSLAGDSFSFYIPEKLVYKDKTIDAGTKLKGEIIKINKTKRFNRDGVFKLHITQICSPELNCVNLDNSLKKPLHIKLFHEEIQKEINKSNTGLWIIEFAVMQGISAKIPGVGVVIEGFSSIGKQFKKDTEHKHSIVYKVSYGIWDSTGIPGIIHFFKIGPNPKYNSGQIVQIRFKKKILKQFFEIAENKYNKLD